MRKKIKKLPVFKTEDDERDFWATHSTVDYFDMSHSVKLSFPNLKPSTRTINMRVPESLFYDLKTLANRKDVPYQSLMKIYLADKVREEFRKYGRLY